MGARSNISAAGTRKQRPPQATSTQDVDQTLQQDVAAFIKQLGFSNNGVASGDGFNDVDFLPQRAQQKIGAPTQDVKSNTITDKQPKKKVKEAQPARLPTHTPAIPSTPPSKATAPPGAAPRSLLPKGTSPIWHEAVAQLPPLPTAHDAAPLTPLAADQLRVHAETLIEHEAAAFAWQMEHGSRGDLRWLQQARRSGTTQDRIAALTVLVTEHAIGSIGALDALLHMAGKRAGGKQVVGTALDALQELFVDKLLPDRKLRFFEQQPLQTLPMGGVLREQHLLAYAVEDAIKRRYVTNCILERSSCPCYTNTPPHTNCVKISICNSNKNHHCACIPQVCCVYGSAGGSQQGHHRVAQGEGHQGDGSAAASQA